MRGRLAILLLFLLASCTADKNKNSLAKLGLKGKVKTLLQTEYRIANKKTKDPEDSVISKCSYEFNNRGNISIECTWLGHDHFKKCIYKFDDKGKPVSAVKYNEDSSFCYRAVFRYNEAGAMMEQLQYDGKDSLNLRIVYHYDKNFNRTEERSFWENGRLLNIYNYTYNAQNQEAGYDFYNADSALVMRVTYAYNDSGNKKEEHKYGEADEKGWVITYTYDAYDKQGNWIIRTTYTNEKPVSVTRRLITYY